jgi:hypothetical protein
MDENNPARLEAFVHVVDRQQRVAACARAH